MKRTLWTLLALALAAPFGARSQSIMEFQAGTNIEVTTGADICADNVIINGTYSGSGTQCSGALPVEFVTMTAVATKNTVTLQWSTATETENYGFEIQRRMVTSQQPQTRNAEPEIQWTQVGFVQGAGTSGSPNNYSYTDDRVSPGRYAYRIRHIDQQGSFAYTSEIEAEVGLAPKEFTLGQNYPNPFNPTTTIEFTLPDDGHVLLKVYDLAGHEVAILVDESLNAGVYHHVVFDASRLGSGAYFFRIAFGGKQLSRKMILLR